MREMVRRREGELEIEEFQVLGRILLERHRPLLDEVMNAYQQGVDIAVVQDSVIADLQEALACYINALQLTTHDVDMRVYRSRISEIREILTAIESGGADS
jgi:hypothetical protein